MLPSPPAAWCAVRVTWSLPLLLPALTESVAAQEASLPLYAGNTVQLTPHLEAFERLLKLLDPELCQAMVAAHERDGMGPSAFGFLHEWLCCSLLTSLSPLLWTSSLGGLLNRCAPHAGNKARPGLLCLQKALRSFQAPACR